MLKKIIIIIISIELFSLLILLFGRTINLGFRFFERQEPLIVYFSKKDLPHPIFNYKENLQSLERDAHSYKNFDPNSVLYFQNFDRFKIEKKINKKKNSNDFFIYLIGGSTVDGTGASTPDETIDAAIRKEINSMGCKNNVKIFNEAVSGNSSKQDFLNISLRLIPYQNSDMIISLQGWNDFLAYAGQRRNQISPLAKFWTSREQKMYNYINARKPLREFFLFSKVNTFSGILFNSLFSNYYFKFVQDKVFKNQLSQSENLDILLKNFFYYQEQSWKISKSNNIFYNHFFQPALIYKKNPTPYEKNSLNGKKDTFTTNDLNNFIFSEAYWKNLENFYENVSKNNPFKDTQWFNDYSKIFENSNDTDFIDHGHLTKKHNLKLVKKYLTK